MKKMYDEIEINETEMTVTASKLLEKIRKNLFIPSSILCILISYVTIKAENAGVFKYIVVPFGIFFVICLRYYIKQHEYLLNNYKFKVNKNSVEYNSNSILIEIPIKHIISIEDKSYYYDFDGNGPFNKGWHHAFKLRLINGKEFIEKIDRKALLLYKYNERDNIIELEINDLLLKHEDYLKVIDYIKSQLGT